MHFLKQSTAVDVLIGPFVDVTDGITGETGESPSVKLSKNGQALAAKNDATTPVSDADGYYNCELDATDTDTVGTLRLTIAATASAVPVFHDFQVVEAVVYNALFGSSSTILTSEDVGLAYESTIATVTSQTQFIMDIAFSLDNLWVGNMCTIHDVSTGEVFTTWIVSATQSTETLTVAAAPPFTAVAGGTPDKIRIHSQQHPRYAINQFAPSTAASVATNAANVRGWFRLLMRSDAAAAADASDQLTDVNSDDGAGSGDYSNSTDSLEAIDAGVNATAINGSTSAAAQLALSAVGILSGAATGTPSTTVMNSDLTGYANDELIGRTIIWTGGTADGQASDITDYAATSGAVTYTAIATAPGSGDTFVIV